MTALSLYGLAVVLTTLAVYVLRASGAIVNRRFAAFTVSVAGWVLGIAGVETGITTELWGRLTFASASLIPTTFLQFSHVFPESSPWPSKPFRTAMSIVGFGLAILSLLTPLVAYNIIRTADGIARTAGPLFSAFACYFLFSSILSVGIFVGRWSKTRGLARAQLQYLVIGMVIFTLGATTTNLLVPITTGRSQYSWLGPYFTLPLILLVTHSIIRHRLMDLRLIVHQGLTHAVVLLVAASSTIFAFRFLLGDSGSDYIRIYTLIILCVTFAVFTAPAQKLLRLVIDPYLYRGRVDYASALRQVTHLLGRLMEPRAFADAIRTILTETVVPEKFGLLLRAGDNIFRSLSSDFPEPISEEIASELVGIATPNRRSPVTLIASTSSTRPPDALFSAGVEIVALLQRHGTVLGMILLGPRRSGDAYFAKELAFLESLSELAAIALENTLLYQQRIQILEYSERLLESLESAVVATDLSGAITSYNPAAVDLLGLPEHRSGLSLDALPREVGWALALAAQAASLPRNVEVNIDHPSRGSVPAILSTAVLRDANRETTGALVVATDLSTVKALERNQRRLEHLSLMARVYAGIAHEIRNPLAAISNFISMLPDRFDDPEYRDIATRLLPAEVARIVGLAERLRLMAPSAGGTLASVALRPLLADIVAIHTPIANDANVKIVLDCPNSVPLIHGDPNQLVQLFVNLLRNAIEAMPNGGVVTIEARQTHADAVVVSITDEGAGVEPSARSKVFEPFFTTKSGGSGLGLAICREIANFHGAALTLSPRHDRRGTVAQVELQSSRDAQPSVLSSMTNTVSA